MSRRAAIAAGGLVGLGLGVLDAAAVIRENPRSFEAAGDAVAFLGASVTFGVAAGLLGGALVALVAPRISTRIVLGVGTALAAFVALGVRLHVGRFFGVPIFDPTYFAANVALAVGCALAGLAIARFAGRPLGAVAKHSVAIPLLLVVAALGATLPLAFRSRAAAPVSSGSPPPSSRDVLLISLDTTRADHLSTYGYPRGTSPALDRLARSGLLWETAYASIPLTNPSHATIFTGLLPREHGVRNNGTALPDSIPTFVPDLARAGWQTAAFVSGIPLKAGLSGLAPGFATYDDAFSWLERVHPMATSLALVRVANRLLPGDLIERRAVGTVAAAVRWLERTQGPRFLWVHLFDPHTPWDAPAVLRQRFAIESDAWSAGGRSVIEFPHADYDAEIRETDRRLEELLQAWDLATRGTGSVILVADHGEGLEQHGELTHGTQLYHEDMHVPCIWRVDDRRLRPNSILRRPREAREIPRGLAWAAGLEADPPSREATEWILFETFAPEGRHDRSAVLTTDGHKVVIDRVTGETTAFDLVGDPGETRPMAATGEPWDTLKKALSAPDASPIESLDPETIRRLQSLGYLH